MDQAARIAEIIGPSLQAMGYSLVRVQVTGSARRTVQVMAERQDEAAMTVDDCADISRTVSALLDVEDPIEGSYQLEVSSPGIDRPLVAARDYERFAGFEARIEVAHPIGGRKRFKGRVLGLDGDDVRLAFEGEEARLPLDDIRRAQLVLTDELIAAAMGKQNG